MKDIFDLFNVDDVPEELVQDIHLTTAEKVEVLLKYATRPLTVKEILTGLYRKFGDIYSSTYVYNIAKVLIKNKLVNFVKDEADERRSSYCFAFPTMKEEEADITIDHVISALKHTSVPVTLTQLVICFYKLFGVVVSKKQLTNKICSYLESGHTNIIKENNCYSLTERTDDFPEPDNNLFRVNSLFKEANDSLKKEVGYALNNGQGAILELLNIHDSLSLDDIITLLKVEYGMDKTYSYVSKALQGLRDKQNYPIIIENKIVRLEKTND